MCSSTYMKWNHTLLIVTSSSCIWFAMPSLNYSMPEMLSLEYLEPQPSFFFYPRALTGRSLYCHHPFLLWRMPFPFFLVDHSTRLDHGSKISPCGNCNLTPSKLPGSTRVSIKIGSTCGTPSGWGVGWPCIALEASNTSWWLGPPKSIQKKKPSKAQVFFALLMVTTFWMHKTFKDAEKTANFNWWSPDFWTINSMSSEVLAERCWLGNSSVSF